VALPRAGPTESEHGGHTPSAPTKHGQAAPRDPRRAPLGRVVSRASLFRRRAGVPPRRLRLPSVLARFKWPVRWKLGRPALLTGTTTSGVMGACGASRPRLRSTGPPKAGARAPTPDLAALLCAGRDRRGARVIGRGDAAHPPERGTSRAPLPLHAENGQFPAPFPKILARAPVGTITGRDGGRIDRGARRSPGHAGSLPSPPPAL
jgi:hypothetical protein